VCEEKTVMGYFKSLSQNLCGGMEENHEKPKKIGPTAKVRTDCLLTVSEERNRYASTLTLLA
jgi:thiamine pyrophosphokinase